ncbi:hypothetical protein N9U65_03685 [Planctomycetaceae bacterium]|nr:hypothetical protein [Planctomycetaceae bacterium]
MATAAEYIVEDREPPARLPREQTPRIAPDPTQLASGALSFDGLVGKESTESILQPIAEDADDDSSWSSEGATVSVIDDAETRYVDELESEWVVSGDPYAGYAQPLCDESSAWDWTHGFNKWGNACKNAYGHMNLLDACKNRYHWGGPACWTVRADAVMLWRSAPYSRELVITGPGPTGTSALNANQLESGMAAGPRIQAFCKGACGNALEFGYLGAWSFQSEKFLRGTATNAFFADLIGNSNSFQDGDVSLTSHIQTLELNCRTPIAAGNVEFICGIRWLEWTESFSLNTQTPGPGFVNTWSSRTVNNLYGGQIGIDTLVYSTNWLHVESVLKGGAYWNDALSRQIYQENGVGTEVSAYDSPSAAAFVGELGFTGVLPLTSHLDFRFGYLVFWLQGIAQPTRQLSLPVSTTGDPLVLQDGGTVVQGLTLGLEGRW